MVEQRIDEMIASLKEPLTRTLQAWLKVPSLKAEAAPGAPFGPKLQEMLEMALRSCQELGLKTRSVDGYAGEAEIGEGSDEDALAILAHVDVVPAGDGWTREPFGAQLEGDLLYGRGAGDDKGPLAAAMYAMHAIKLAGIPLKRKVKLIIGCDEESGMEDIQYYRRHAVLPREGFSPDAVYPVINLEKGMCGLHLSAKVPDEGLQVLSLNVGERPNVIPGAAAATVKGGEDLVLKAAEISKKYGWPVAAQAEGGRVHLVTTGVNGHAAYPELARNAIGQLLIMLKELGVEGPLKQLAAAVGTQYYGEGLGIQSEDAASGKLTCNLGILRIEAGQVFGTLDIRYPLLVNGAMLRDVVAAHLTEFAVKQASFKEPHYVPESSPLVQGVLQAYHEVTGREKKALSTGGGTYARLLEQGVAFGVSFPEDPDLAHQADEHISINSLITSVKIFFRAIELLAGKESL